VTPTIDMSVSPYDRGTLPLDTPARTLAELRDRLQPRWVPSRFNARTYAEDGRLILWNTFSGSVSAFSPGEADGIVSRLGVAGLTDGEEKGAAYLIKRGYLVRDDVNELDRFRYRYARDQWRTDQLEFILLASEDCNFRCVYCYEKFKRGTMTQETCDGLRAFTMKRAPQLKRLGVSWFGGEPLYGWAAIRELAPFFKDVAKQYGIAHSSGMTTNAYLLTEEKATDLLNWGCRAYQITVDGLPEEHDCKRVGRDGSPTYHVILDNLRSLKARRNERFTVSLRVNYDNKNSPALERFLEVLSEDFAGDPRFSMRFRPVGKWGGEQDDKLDTCGLGEERAVLRKLQTKATEMNLSQEGGVTDLTIGSQVCYAARPYNFLVGASGKLMKCTIALDDFDANIVGQLQPDGTMQLNDERMAAWVNPHFESDSMCKSCYVLPTCQGSACPLTRLTKDERTCCGVKSNLKHELRYTLSRATPRKPAPLITA
jgi:uncharacterized protein